MKRYKRNRNEDSEDKEQKERYNDASDDDEIEALKEAISEAESLANEMNDDDDDPSNICINVKEIFNQSDDYPLCGFFLETRKNAPEKSALSWLSICDKDTIDMMIEIAEKIKKENEEKETRSNKAKPNDKTEDIFDKQDEEEEDDIVTDESDFFGLAMLIYSWESDELKIPVEMVDELQSQLSVYVNAEAMRREKMLKMRGNGLLYNSTTKYSFTEKGERLSKSILEKMGIIAKFLNKKPKKA